MSWFESVSFAEAAFEIIDGDRGKNYPKHSEFKDAGYCLFLSATNVTKTGFDFSTCQFIDQKRDAALNKGKLQRDDVVLTTRGTIGNTAYFNDAVPFNHLRLNSGMVILRCDKTKLLPAFLYHFVRSPSFFSQVNGLRSGVAQPQLPIRDMRQIKIPLPPLPVQRSIAGILSTYDELIENSHRRIKILDAMARAVYREWFVHFRIPGQENHPRVASPLGEIPQGWETKFVKDVAAVTYGFPFQSGRFKPDGVGVSVIRIRDILAGASATFTEEMAESKYHVKNGHILVGMDGDFHMNIWSSGHAYQNQRIARFESKGEMGNFHLFLALEKPIQEFNKAIVGTTVAHLGDMHIKTIQIVWPPEDIRSKAREFLEPLSEQVIALKRQTNNLRRTRDLLLPRLLSGQIAVDAA